MVYCKDLQSKYKNVNSAWTQVYGGIQGSNEMWIGMVINNQHVLQRSEKIIFQESTNEGMSLFQRWAITLDIMTSPTILTPISQALQLNTSLKY